MNKSNIMTREELKQLLPIIQAFVNGKTIQIATAEDTWKDLKELTWEGKSEVYRIKPEPKYRPFKNKDECWNEMLKHQPFGWLMFKKTSEYEHKTTICNHTLYSNYFSEYTFADGTPFGIKEE